MPQQSQSLKALARDGIAPFLHVVPNLLEQHRAVAPTDHSPQKVHAFGRDHHVRHPDSHEAVARPLLAQPLAGTQVRLAIKSIGGTIGRMSEIASTIAAAI